MPLFTPSAREPRFPDRSEGYRQYRALLAALPGTVPKLHTRRAADCLIRRVFLTDPPECCPKRLSQGTAAQLTFVIAPSELRGGAFHPKEVFRAQDFIIEAQGIPDIGAPGDGDCPVAESDTVGSSDRAGGAGFQHLGAGADSRHGAVQSRCGHGDDADGGAGRLRTVACPERRAFAGGLLYHGCVHHGGGAGSFGACHAGGGGHERHADDCHGRRGRGAVSGAGDSEDRIQEEPGIDADVLLYASVCAGVFGGHRRERGLSADGV